VWSRSHGRFYGAVVVVTRASYLTEEHAYLSLETDNILAERVSVEASYAFSPRRGARQPVCPPDLTLEPAADAGLRPAKRLPLDPPM
jgi:hypothetical protein